jgi:predicted FMN-binding regulatory protein PaiB
LRGLRRPGVPGVTKQEFMLQATLNGLVGLSQQTERIGGAYIVSCAEAAWDALSAAAELDAARTRAAAKPTAEQTEDRV